VSFSADGRTLVTGADDFTMRWWSVDAGQEMIRFENVDPSGSLQVKQQLC